MVVVGETTLANRSAKSDDVRKGNIIAAKGEGVSAAHGRACALMGG